MATELVGYINLAASNQDTFTNAMENDFMIYTSNSTQNILIGVQSNVPANLTLTSNLVSFNTAATLSNSVYVYGVTNLSNVTVLSSNLTFSNFGAITLYTSNSYLGFSTTTPSEAIHAVGKIYTPSQHLGNSNDSASVPSFSFKENSNTGLFHPSNNTIGITTNGAERFRVSELGYVGIGTSNPGSILAVAGGITVGAALSNSTAPGNGIMVQGVATLCNNLGVFGTATISNVTTLQSNLIVAGLASFSNSSTIYGVTNLSNVTIVSSNLTFSNFGSITLCTSNNYLGIATLAPSESVHTTGKVFTELQFLCTSNDSSSIPSFSFKENSNTGVFHPSNNSVGVTTGGVERFRITDTGVGIGMSNPQVQLDVGGTANFGLWSNLGTAANTTVYGLERSRYVLQFPSYANTLSFRIGAKIAAVNKQTWSDVNNRQLVQSTDLAFLTVSPCNNTLDATSEKMRIMDTGFVGIGSSNPLTALMVASPSTGSNSVIVATSSTYSNFLAMYSGNSTDAFQSIAYGSNSDLRFGTWTTPSGCNWSEKFRMTTGGYLGVGTTSPSYPIHVVTQSNNVSIYASFDIAAYSDRRVKDNLQKIDNAIDKVCKISGYTYTRNDDISLKRYAGVIAQEVKDILPEVVHEDPNTGMLSVAYGNMIGLLVEAIKDLKKEITLLKEKK